MQNQVASGKSRWQNINMPFRYTFYFPHFLTSNAQIGKTKVFLRAGQMAELDALRTEVLGLSAKKIQSKLRSFLARKKYIELQQCATQIQAICRGILFYKNWNENFHSPVLCLRWDLLLSVTPVLCFRRNNCKKALWKPS